MVTRAAANNLGFVAGADLFFKLIFKHLMPTL